MAEPASPDRDGPDPAAAFDLLGHEARLSIVEALADARRNGWRPNGLAFSDLRKAAGIRDAGRFNYHLDALRGTFVTKRDEGYVLTNAGFELEGTARERLASTAESRSGTIDGDCPDCGESIEATYENESLRLACPEHGNLFETALPPAAAEGRTLEDVIRLGLAHSEWAVRKARNGACPHCWGEMSASAPVEASSTHAETGGRDPARSERREVLAEFQCADCGLVFRLPVAACVGSHPAVVAYYHEQDVDPRDAWLFGLELLTGAEATVPSTDPTRIDVVVRAGGAADGLVVTLDDETRVVSVERRPAVGSRDPDGGRD